VIDTDYRIARLIVTTGMGLILTTELWNW